MTTKAGLLSAIHALCVDCSGGSAREVARCALRSCPLHALRLGRDPTPARGAPASGFGKNSSPGSGETRSASTLAATSDGDDDDTEEDAP
jgi:hypothetical protein